MGEISAHWEFEEAGEGQGEAAGEGQKEGEPEPELSVWCESLSARPRAEAVVHP